MSGLQASLDSDLAFNNLSDNRDLNIVVDNADRELAEAKRIIYSVDLTSTLERLVKVDGWLHYQAIEAIRQYRNYLFLRKKYPNEKLPPSYEIDEAWHAHILHTKEYRDFCKKVFYDREDKYLDHWPHIANADSGLALKQAYETTKKLYRKEFNEVMHKILRKGFFKKRLDKLRNWIIMRYPEVAE